MTNAAPIDETLSQDAIQRGPAGWARPLIERDLAVLGELRDAALVVVKALAAQAQASTQPPPPPPADEAPPPPPPPFTGESVLAFYRAARAVRMTVALRVRLIDDLERLDELQGRRAEHRGEEARIARKGEVGRVLTRVIHDAAYAPSAPGDADGASDESAETEADDFSAEGFETEGAEGGETEGERYVRLVGEASERLKDKEAYGDILDRPLSDVIDQVCGDIGLTPDWRRLAEEAWAKREIASGRIGASLAKLLQTQPPAPTTGKRRWVGSAPRPARPPTPKPPARESNAEAEAPPTPFRAPAAEPPPPPPSPAFSPIAEDRVEEAASYSPVPAPPEPPPPEPAPSNDARWFAPPIPPPPVGLPGELPPPRKPRLRPYAAPT